MSAARPRRSPPVAIAARALAGIALVLGVVVPAARAAGAEAPPEHPRALRFDILRKGAVIGEHVMRFTDDGPRRIVDIEIRIKVTFASIPLFRYEHTSREVWQGGRLVALDTRTDDDGTHYRVAARAEGDHLVVDGRAGHLILPGDLMPTSYWDRRMMLRSEALDSQRGRVVHLVITPPAPDTVEVDGAPAETARYGVSGDLDMTLWYLPDGEWAKLVFEAKGAPIEYVRRAAGAAVDAPATDGKP
ncbi:MAG TPA: DUF6134 family protein [Candidatus Sulfotelmatobacter sp.]|nr:DUF6134 family protein [Candidatus Sulfotelmatobacter sp.]